MRWLLWRQHRTQAVLLLGALLCVAAATIPAGLNIRSTYDTFGIAHCAAAAQGDGCPSLQLWFGSDWMPRQVIDYLGLLPVALGALIGGPLLAREFEERTYRLAWSQGVTRRRWVLSKLVFTSALGVAGCVGVSLLIQWYAQPYAHLAGPFDWFDYAPPVYAARFLCALGLAACSGALVRRSVTAAAIGLVGGIGAMALFAGFTQRLLSPLQAAVPPARSWIVAKDYTDSAGHAVSMERLRTAFHPVNPSNGAWNAYLRARGVTETLSYHPVGRFWTLQLMEAGILTAVAVVLLAVTVSRVRRGVR